MKARKAAAPKAAKRTASDRKPSKAEVASARKWLAERGALPPEPGDPELGDYLAGIVHDLERAEAFALVVVNALEHENTTDSTAAAWTLRECADEITEQIGALKRAIEGACLAGSRMVVNSNRLAAVQAQDVQS